MHREAHGLSLVHFRVEAVVGELGGSGRAVVRDGLDALARRARLASRGVPPRGTTIQLDIATYGGGRVAAVRSRFAELLSEGVVTLELETSGAI
jgi:hypothetical protein